MNNSMGYTWDRIITYIKDPGLFVVFDIFKAEKEDFFTLADLWHTRKILSQGPYWYGTVYDRIRNEKLPDSKALLIL